MNDQLQTQIATVLKALQQGAVHYGPQALELAYQVKRVNSIGLVIRGFLGLAILAVIYRVWFNYVTENNFDGEDKMFSLLLCFIVCIPVFVLSAPIFDIWNWTGIFYPGLSLAHDILVKVMP